MLRHVSFSVREPETVAFGIAQLLFAEPFKAPSPPFPEGTWFVVLGDDFGSLIELTPWGTVVDPSVRGGLGRDENMAVRTASHILACSPLDEAKLKLKAQALGWACEPADAGLFQFSKVWIPGGFLLEVMSPDQARTYRARFGGAGIEGLASKLSELERAVRQARAQTSI